MPPSKKSPFIIIEAIDGAGKSTQTKKLIKRLKKQGLKVSQFHFPQEDSATGQLIYNKFLHSHNDLKFSRREQALLYLQDFFSQHDVMSKAVKQGPSHVVISDRYYTSTLAYQTASLSGTARQRMADFILRLALKGEPTLLKPNLVLYLDIPPQIASANLGQANRDYHENIPKLTAFRQSHLKSAAAENWTTVSCVDPQGEQRTPADIHKEIWQHVQKLLPQ